MFAISVSRHQSRGSIMTPCLAPGHASWSSFQSFPQNPSKLSTVNPVPETIPVSQFCKMSNAGRQTQLDKTWLNFTFDNINTETNTHNWEQNIQQSNQDTNDGVLGNNKKTSAEKGKSRTTTGWEHSNNLINSRQENTQMSSTQQED